MGGNGLKLGIAAIAGAGIIGGAILFFNTNEPADLPTGSMYRDLINNISAAIPTVWLSNSAPSGSDLKLVGQMKPFQLASSISPRPDVSWKDVEGKKVTLKNFEGAVVMLNLWASWCAPCIRELPSINRLQAGFSSDKFAVVALNIDRGGKAIASRSKQKLKLDQLQLYLDQDNSVAKKLKIKTLPTTIIFDAKGRELGKMEAAAEWDGKAAYSLIQYFLNHPNHADKLPIKEDG